MRKGLAALCVMITIALVKVVPAGDSAAGSGGLQLPPIETFIGAPVELEHISIWVPAAKFGPEINWSCNTREDYSHSAVLSAAVEHTKTERCPEEFARVLAEYTAGYNQQTLPLTILGTWRWEYSLSPSQFDSVRFDLRKRGGSWEGSWEAVLTQSAGSIDLQWWRISAAGDFNDLPDTNKAQSHIETQNFSTIRMRDGYPKERKLHR